MFVFTPTPLQGAFVIQPQVFGDERGFFLESYNQREFCAAGVTADFVQDNHSRSRAGVLRGLHFQMQSPQAKLVRVTAWSVYDVIVDLRSDSPSFGQWYGVVLSAENKQQLFVPRGMAHGFLTLEDGTEFVYKCDDFYTPASEWGIAYNSPELAIDWDRYYDQNQLLLSEKDKQHPTWTEFVKKNPF